MTTSHDENTHTGLKLATRLRMAEFTDLNMSELFFEMQLYKLSLKNLLNLIINKRVAQW